MKDLQEHQQQAKQKQGWAACDPVTLVSAARESLYEGVTESQRKNPQITGPLEEVISRFEQQSRATFGSSVLPGTTAQSSS